MAENIKSTSDLRKLLIDTIGEVKAGTVDARTANTVAKLSTTILASAKLDLEYLRFQRQSETDGVSVARVLNLIDPQVPALESKVA